LTLILSIKASGKVSGDTMHLSGGGVLTYYGESFNYTWDMDFVRSDVSALEASDIEVDSETAIEDELKEKIIKLIAQ
jgi:hypothetical protein